MSAEAQPISREKLAANQRNAQHSTGPKTPAGKQRASQNALKHGLLAREVVISVGEGKEDEDEFHELLSSLTEDYKPVGTMEEFCIQEIAACIWRKRRGYRYENGAIREHADALGWNEERFREEDLEMCKETGLPLDNTAAGLSYLLKVVDAIDGRCKRQLLRQSDVEWLRNTFPEVVPNSNVASGQTQTERSPQFQQELSGELAELRIRLANAKVGYEKVEKLASDAKRKRAALPGPDAVALLQRYETANDRHLQRILDRLNQLQKNRKEGKGAQERQHDVGRH